MVVRFFASNNCARNFGLDGEFWRGAGRARNAQSSYEWRNEQVRRGGNRVVSSEWSVGHEGNDTTEPSSMAYRFDGVPGAAFFVPSV